MIHLLVPMSGRGQRFRDAGYAEPKPLIPVSGRPMIARVLDHFPPAWPVHAVISAEHRSTALAATLRELRPAARVTEIAPHAEGPLRAIEAALEHIPPDDAVFVSYCDYGMVWDARQFERLVEQSQCDACLVCYRGFHAHYLDPVTYAYARLEGERVREVREKGSFTADRETEFASAGGYYFRTARILRDAVAHQRHLDLRCNGEFYTSLTVESLLRLDPAAVVRVFEVPGFFQWGTPAQLRDFEYWEKTYARFNRHLGRPLAGVDQVLMPMAGRGSRLAAAFGRPKPLIPVRGRPMFERALDALPPARGRTVVVALAALRDRLPPVADREYVFLEDTPAGQALSTAHGARALDPARPVVVSSCDHAVILNPAAWAEFTRDPRADAAIFVVKGFPGVARHPRAYAYVRTHPGEDRFPRVADVSVKMPVGEDPRGDFLLIGTFWFKRAGLIGDAVTRLIERNLTVNGELYLDSVFALMIEAGLTVRAFEVDGYVNWGDPASLSEAEYWFEHHVGRRPAPRPAWPVAED